jgi:hypothetical protein
MLGLAPSLAFSQATDSWKWQGSVYAYLPDIGGSTTFPAGGGSSATVDASRIVDSLKFTFMGSLEARNGQWGVFTDVIYMDLGNTKNGSRDITLGGASLPGGAEATLSFDLKGWAWTLAGERRVLSGAGSTMDILAGARLFDMRQTLGWEVTGNVASIPVLNRSGRSEAKISNWDAIVGLKGRMAFGEGNKWFVPYYVDIGTGESDLTWQAVGGLGYSFKWGDVVAAWRYIDYDMKAGKNIESMTFNGPAIAAVFRW